MQMFKQGPTYIAMHNPDCGQWTSQHVIYAVVAGIVLGLVLGFVIAPIREWLFAKAEKWVLTRNGGLQTRGKQWSSSSQQEVPLSHFKRSIGKHKKRSYTGSVYDEEGVFDSDEDVFDSDDEEGQGGRRRDRGSLHLYCEDSEPDICNGVYSGTARAHGDKERQVLSRKPTAGSVHSVHTVDTCKVANPPLDLRNYRAR